MACVLPRVDRAAFAETGFFSATPFRLSLVRFLPYNIGGERLYRGKGPLNPSRDHNISQVPQKEGGVPKQTRKDETSVLAFLLCNLS